MPIKAKKIKINVKKSNEDIVDLYTFIKIVLKYHNNRMWMNKIIDLLYYKLFKLDLPLEQSREINVITNVNYFDKGISPFYRAKMYAILEVVPENVLRSV